MRGIFDSTTVRNLTKKVLVNEKENGRSKGEEKWSEKALKTVVKQLRKSKCLEDLERAVTSEDPSTKCVIFVIPADERAPYGYLLRSFPHYTYCKLWRFPDLITYHQLRPVAHCLHPFNKSRKVDELCINPYHYELIQNPKPSVMVPTNSRLDPSQQPHMDSIMQYSADTIGPEGVPNLTISAEQCHAMDGMPPVLHHDDASSTCSHSNVVSPTAAFGASPLGYMTDDMEMDVQSPDTSSPTSFFTPLTQPQVSPPVQSSSNGFNFPASPSDHNNAAAAAALVSPLTSTQHASSAFGSPLTSYSSSQSPKSNGTQRTADYERQVEEQRRISEALAAIERPLSTSAAVPDLTNVAMGGNDAVSVEYCDPPFWCTFSYYELNQRVGDSFHASKPSFVIDGFTSADVADRFCVGRLPNVNRTPEVMEARKHIGKGARLYYIGGEVYCENLGEYAVFVQSFFVAQSLGLHQATVVKIPAHCNLKIFSMADFARMLNTAVQKGFEATYALTRMCTIRMSFVKGWGNDYRRQTVTSTPCWAEVHLNGPLQWLDRVLLQMGGPPARCTSFS